MRRRQSKTRQGYKARRATQTVSFPHVFLWIFIGIEAKVVILYVRHGHLCGGLSNLAVSMGFEAEAIKDPTGGTRSVWPLRLRVPCVFLAIFTSAGQDWGAAELRPPGGLQAGASEVALLLP